MLLVLNKMVHVKHLAEYQANSKHPRNVTYYPSSYDSGSVGGAQKTVWPVAVCILSLLAQQPFLYGTIPSSICVDPVQHLRVGRVNHRRRQWHPTPVLLPGKSHGRRSLVGCSPWGCWGSDTTERLHFHFSLFTFMHWRRKWQPTPVFLPGESQGRGSLVGCRLWGRTESDTTEAT